MTSRPSTPRTKARATGVVLLVGSVCSIGSGFGIARWVEGRYGRWDPEFVGMEAVLPFVTALLALALVGWLWARGSRWLFAALVVASTVIIGFIAILNVPGALNGLSATAPWLGLGLGGPIALVFVGLVMLASR